MIDGSCTRISPPAPRDHRPSSGKGILRRWRILVELRSPDDARQKPIRVGNRSAPASWRQRGQLRVARSRMRLAGFEPATSAYEAITLHLRPVRRTKTARMFVGALSGLSYSLTPYVRTAFPHRRTDGSSIALGPGSRVRLTPRAPRSRRPTAENSVSFSYLDFGCQTASSPRMTKRPACGPLQAGRSSRSLDSDDGAMRYAMRRSSELPATVWSLCSFLPTYRP